MAPSGSCALCRASARAASATARAWRATAVSTTAAAAGSRAKLRRSAEVRFTITTTAPPPATATSMAAAKKRKGHRGLRRAARPSTGAARAGGRGGRDVVMRDIVTPRAGAVPRAREMR